MEGFENIQIKRTNTAIESDKSRTINPEVTQNNIFREEETLGRKSVGTNISDPKVITGIKKQKENEKKNRKLLKKKSENVIPEIKQVKKAKKTGKASKTISAKQLAARQKQERYQQTSETMEKLHQQFEQEISDIYGNNFLVPGAQDYEDLSRSDKDKRIKEAIKREDYAAKVSEYETRAEKEKNTRKKENLIEDVNVKSKEKLISKVKLFMENSAKEHLLDSDENYVANLSVNYQLCAEAEYIGRILNNAAKGDYLPKELDLDAVQRRIAGFAELKIYMDNRRQLIKSPYYKYFSSGDLAYTDGQIEELIMRSENAEFINYLNLVRNLRAQGYKRSKGLKSLNKRIADNAAHRTEVLRTRQEKLEIIDRMSDHALRFRGDRALRDRDYDSKFSRRLFEKKLREFNSLKVSDLHLKSFKDLADNFDDNARLFEQAREFETLLVTAVRTGQHQFTDDEMIGLRAKLRVFMDAERYSYSIQNELLKRRDTVLEDMTYDDIEKQVSGSLRNTDNTEKLYDNIPLFKLGDNLEGHLTAVRKIFKKEHDERENTIKRMYGLMHPKTVKKDGKDGFVPGDFSAEELERRRDSYQKNALYADHLISINQYFASVWQNKRTLFIREYSKITGINISELFKPGRVLNGYSAGMSSDEFKKLADVFAFGSENDKQEVYRDILKEIENTDPEEYDLRQGEKRLDNAFYKSKISNISSGIGDLKGFLKDEKSDKTVQAYIDTAASHLSDLTFLHQNYVANASLTRALTIEDFFTMDGKLESFVDYISDQIETYNGYFVNDKKIIGAREWVNLEKIIKIPKFGSELRVRPERKDQPVPAVETEIYSADKYAGYLKQGLWKKTGVKDIASIKSFYAKQSKNPDSAGLQLAETLAGSGADLNADNETRAKYCADAEKVFEGIMSVDPSEFAFDSYLDIVSDEKRFARLSDVVHMASGSGKIISNYRKYLENKGNLQYGKQLKLNEDHLKEIEARCELLGCAKGFFDGSFERLLDSPFIAEFKTLDAMLHQNDKTYNDMIAAAEGDEEKISRIKNIQDFIKSLKGFDINTPLNILEHRIRADHGILNNELSSPLEVLNVLRGTESILKGNEVGVNRIDVTLMPGQELMRQTAPRFKEKKISVRDRENLINNPKSGQYVKKRNMEELYKAKTSYASGIYETKKRIDTGYMVTIGNETTDYLCNFADPESIIRDYSDKATRFRALDSMTRQIMSMGADLDLTSDENFASNALKLEIITKTVYAYKNIMAANPDYAERLKNRIPGDQSNDETKVNKAVGKLLAISDYYRARKLLMTNSYYVLHENSELSRNKKSALNDEQRKIADMYELMDKCAARLKDGDYDARECDYTEQLLDRLEEEAKGDAYLTGRIDETRMDAAALDKTYGKFKKLLEETHFHPSELIKFKRMIEDPKKYPKLQKYLTDDVKAYIYSMFLNKSTSEITGNIQEDCQYNDRQMAFYKLLEDKIKYTQKETDPQTGKSTVKTLLCTDFDLIDPNTGEELKFHTDPVRLIGDLAFMFDGQIAEGEFLDMMDGLLIGTKGGLDLNDPAQMAYARDRWLKSAKKLYEFERTAVKRFEQTYGNMISEIPVGFFLQSMGNDLSGFYKRMRMVGQSSLEMNDEKHVKTADGEKISVGELLVRNGLINKSDDRNFAYLSSKYQEQTGFVSTYLGNVATVMADIPMSDEYSANATTAYNWLYSAKNTPLKGPKMSKSRRRKLWKDACEMEHNYVLGGKCHLKVNKEDLNLYTPDERKELKKQRARDKKTAAYVEAYMEERADMLYERTIAMFGTVKLSDEDRKFIRTNLIYFHPGMYQTGEYKEEVENGVTHTTEAEVQDAYKYYRIIKDFLGVSVQDGDLMKAKKDAFKKLTNMSTPGVADSSDMISPEDIMSDFDVRQNPDDVIYGTNDLLKLEARHKMHLAIQDLAARDDVKQLMDEKLHKNYREAIRKNLQTEIIRVMMRSDFYLNLRDLENPGKTWEEREYELLKNAGMYLVNQEYADFETEVLTPEVRKTLKKYKIRIDDPVFEKKEAPKTEKADVKKTEKADVKKTEDKVSEKKSEKSAKKNEKPLNTINIINEKENLNVIHEEKENLNVIHEEEEVPAIMAPVFDGLEYDKQGVYQYCWACTLAGLMNAHAGKQITSLKAILNKSNKLKLPTFKESGFEKQKVYDDAVSLAQDMYDGNKTGNPSIIGDYVFRLLPNTAIRSAMIGVEKGTEKESQTVFRQMAEAQLKRGPFGILHNGHYVMVRGIQEDKLLVNNSLKRNPSEVVPYDYTISQIFSAKKGNMKYKQIELVWLQDIKGNEQAIADEFQFKYDGKSGRYEVDATKLKDSQNKGADTILHRDGIEGSYITNNGMVSQQIYVPKSLRQNAAGKAEIIGEKEPVNFIINVSKEKEKEKKPEQKTEKKPKQKTEEKAEKKEIKTEKKKKEQTKLPAFIKEINDKKQKLADNLNSEADTIENAGLMHRYITNNIDSIATVLGAVNTLEGNKNLKDEHRSLRILLLDPARCTNRELSLKCLELEKIFQAAFNAVQAFDLNFKSTKELPDEKRTKSRRLAVAMKALPPESVDFYEKMIDSKAVTTALEKDQFLEFKAKWILMRNLEPVINGLPEIMEDAEKNNIDTDKLLTMPYAEIHTLTEECKDKDVKQIYAAILAAKEGLDAIGLKPGGNCVEVLNNERKKLGLGDETKTGFGLVNIITRRAKAAAEYRGYASLESRLKSGAEEPAVIDTLYEGSGIPKEDLEQIKDAARAKLKLTIKLDSALPPEEAGELEEMKKGASPSGMDPRGFVTLLRPVNVDKNGKPATKEDEENQKLNVRDWKAYRSGKLSDRAPHLDYLANEMINNMFSPEQLMDPEYIRANKERAIRCMAFMHYGREHLIDHWKYFITHKDSRIRVFAFLFRGSKYSEITEKMISTALYGYGYGSAALGNSSQTGAVVPFSQGDDYKFIKETNERLAEKSVESSGMLVRGFKTLHARGENATATGKGSKDLVKGMKKDVSYGLEDLTDANKYLMIKKYGKFRKTKKFPYAQIRQDSLDLMGEFFKKKNDKNYIASVLKDIEAYMKTYEPHPKLVSGIENDLK